MISFAIFVLFLTLEDQNFLGHFLKLLSEAKQLVNNGSMEITLLGQNVNAYSFKNKKLSDLLFELK